MSPHEQIAEEKIQEALARGEAEALPGRGQPLKHLDAYFATPEPLRMAFSVLKNAAVFPEELELLQRIRQLETEAAALTREEERTRVRKTLAELTALYGMKMQRLGKNG